MSENDKNSAAKYSPVTVRRIIRTVQKNERPNRVKLLISILNRGDDEKMSELLNDFSVSLAFSCIGMGTARSAVLNYLGIGTSEKSVMFSLIPESDEDAVLDRIKDEMSLYLVGRGISFTLPLAAVSELVAKSITSAAASKTVDWRRTMNNKERNYDLVIAVVAAGYVDEAMEAARGAGAAGGTIIRARSVNNSKAEQFVGISLHEQSEMLLILSQHSQSPAIIDALNEAVGLKSEARGIIYALPVDKTAGVGAAPVAAEPEKAEEAKPEEKEDEPVYKAAEAPEQL